MLDKNKFNLFLNNMTKFKYKEQQCSFCHDVLKPQEVYYVDEKHHYTMCYRCMYEHRMVHIHTDDYE